MAVLLPQTANSYFTFEYLMEISTDVLKATTAFTKENRTKSWFVLFSTIALLAGVWVLTYHNINLAAKIVSSIVLSLLFVRLFVIYHDYLHLAILQKSKLAEVIFTIWGAYILSPPKVWKDSHNFHHHNNSKLYTSHIGSYPIVTKEDFVKATKFERFMYLFIRHPFTISMGYFFTFVLGMTIMNLVKKGKVQWMTVFSLALHISVGASIWIFLGGQAFILSFLFPHVLAGALGSYLFYAQHNFPTATFKTKGDWSYLDAAINSSSHMKMSPIMNFFTANIGLHHIHHANPSIPFYRLPEVYEKVPALQNAKTTTLLPWDVVNCLKLKVWDGDKNRMITLRELREYERSAAA